jgi:hypothetical protein
MALTYIEGKEQMALEFCERQLELEGNPNKRRELKAIIVTLKAKIGQGEQDFMSHDNETIVST